MTMRGSSDWLLSMVFLSSALVSSKDYLLSSLLHFSPRDETNTVGPSFRLGLPGLLTSEELRQKGYKSNNLLHDQRTAFQWVKQHIAGFGGDADNITVIGESTGAVATTLHLYSQQKLFNRAIATGGSCLLIPLFSPEDHERTYQQVMSILGLAELGPGERIQRLLSMPMDEIIARLPPSVALLPMIDGDIIPQRPTYVTIADQEDRSMPGKQWAEGLMIGDSQFDSSTLATMMAHLKPNIRKRFSASIRNSLSTTTPDVAEALLEAYGFNSPALADPAADDEAAFLRFLHFANDIGYYAATVSFARGWPSSSSPSSSKALVFFFNEPNPWPGPFQGQATHVLDVVFLFQNFNDRLPPAQRAAAEGFALDLMAFVSGKTPWNPYTPGARTAKVFGPSLTDAVTKVVADAESVETGRRATILELGKQVGLDKLAQAFGRFNMGL
ncbi:hypothetical protein HRR80_000792 [Exophiala dermatitidis]|uniref:Carboxylic ester hydrolase n=1 Tax=Exophiala dermatitidis TaxID=5970 RepID=A0AAN6IZ52_EXODE|nr:hypothetical protein HRR76_009284 [Exophiala dermatitidis]KAJ4558806.1 hypothetical protein HRR77_000785 [Exophiala dermatitidis]KAJ4590516.1 hypothetical protein HRR82_000869 [Exophiala dermatitidis]KAJ4636307.1 hypothetical protein HRR86_000734 [Exophiala dermatitidis]KAJ4698200.1 hypothetical protein HRR87_001355 [Exophiala dermatitidis]